MVPKEIVLYPGDKAQNVLMSAMKKVGCENTRLLPFKGTFTIFKTPSTMPNPFGAKVLEAVLQTANFDKGSPSL